MSTFSVAVYNKLQIKTHRVHRRIERIIRFTFYFCMRGSAEKYHMLFSTRVTNYIILPMISTNIFV